MSHWEEKSISKSLKLYCKDNEACSKYDNVETKIKDIYGIRSMLVHTGEIGDKKEDFEKKYFHFLKKLVKDILMDKINQYY